MGTQLQLFKLGNKLLSPKAKAAKDFPKQVDKLFKRQLKAEHKKIGEAEARGRNASALHDARVRDYETTSEAYEHHQNILNPKIQEYYDKIHSLDTRQKLSLDRRRHPDKFKEFDKDMRTAQVLRKDLEKIGWRVNMSHRGAKDTSGTYVDISEVTPRTLIMNQRNPPLPKELQNPIKVAPNPRHFSEAQAGERVQRSIKNTRERIQHTRLLRRAAKRGLLGEIPEGSSSKLATPDITKMTTYMKDQNFIESSMPKFGDSEMAIKHLNTRINMGKGWKDFAPDTRQELKHKHRATYQGKRRWARKDNAFKPRHEQRELISRWTDQPRVLPHWRDFAGRVDSAKKAAIDARLKRSRAKEIEDNRAQGRVQTSSRIPGFRDISPRAYTHYLDKGVDKP